MSEGDETDAKLDELLPIKKHLAPSWGDSLSIRGMRGYISTHIWVTGRKEQSEGSHSFEATIKSSRVPSCRALIYLPPGDARVKERGVLVHFHGGGWSICTPEMEAQICAHFARTLGCIVIAPDYAKSPERYFPHALRQAHGLLNWITAPSSSDGLASFLAEKQTSGLCKEVPAFDRTRLALTGSSSGGNIAAALALLVQQAPLQEKSRIVALGLQYPGLNLARAYEDKLATLQDASAVVPPPFASKLFLRCFLPHPYHTKESRESVFISPGLAPDEDLRTFPPTAIMTAENDHFRVESEEFIERLDKLGVANHIRTFPGAAHAFDLRVSEATRVASDHARDESRRLLSEHISQYL